MEKLIGSVSQEEFIRGLLLASADNSLGDMWEKCADCNHCMFIEKCHALCETLDEQNKNPTCGQVINLLLGDLKPEDIPVRF